MKRFLIVFCMFLACSFISQAKNYVVCIGIADYPDKDMDLKLSATDAITMKGLYEKNGDSEIVVFTNENARVNSVISALNSLFAKASSVDAIIFFFSGHGVPGCFVCYDGVLKYDTLTNIMSKSGANSKMIFADACFSGKARKEGKGEYRSKADNVLFFLSSRSGEESMERKTGWKNSLFTAFLERGLRGGADVNKDRVITAKELFLFVSKGVAEQSMQRQHPVMWGRFDDNMPIMNWQKN